MNPRLAVAVAATKSSAVVNNWSMDDLESPADGIRRHFEELKSLDSLWGMSAIMSKIDTGPEMVEAYEAHRAWSGSVASMYEYLLTHSSSRLPQALQECGKHLVLEKELMGPDHLEPELVTRLKDRAIALTMDINLGEFKLISEEEDAKVIESAKKAYEMLEGMYCSTEAEEVWKTTELNRIAGVIEGDQDRSEWPRYYMEQLDLYVRYLMKVEEHLEASV